MSIIATTINGYTVRAIFQTEPGLFEKELACGVIIEGDLSDPGYLEAVSIGQKHLPDVEIANRLADCCNGYGEVNGESLAEKKRRFEEIAKAYLETLPNPWLSDEYLGSMDNLLNNYSVELEGRRKKENSEGMLEMQRRNRAKGFVYLIQAPTKVYKIGKTRNPDSRLREFKTALPFKVELITLIKTEDMPTLERELHDTFSDKRVNGEWFNLSDEDVQYIKGLAEQSS